MISLVIPTKNIRSGWRRKIVDITFPLLKKIKHCQVIIADYASNDGTKEFVEDLGLEYAYTKPNEDEFINISKCLNNGIMNYAKSNYIVPAGTDFIFPDNMAIETERLFNKYWNEYVMIRPKTFDFNIDTYELKERPLSYNYSYTREMYEIANGYDERFHEWGGEDHDFKDRLQRRIDVKTIVPELIFLLHVEHPYDHVADSPEHKRNLRILSENWSTNDTQIVNSYLPKKSPYQF